MDTKSSRRIVVALSNGYQLRLLFHSGVVQRLCQAGLDVIVATPVSLDTEVQNELGPNVEIAFPQIGADTRLARIYQVSRRFWFWPNRLTPAQENFRKRFQLDHPALSLPLDLSRKLLPFGVKKVIHRRILSHKGARDLLRSVRPQLVLMCSPGFAFLDSVLLNEANKLGILTVAVAQSWDNLSTKGYTYPKPDLMCCWGRQMWEDAITLQGFDKSRLAICGPPHFDIYADAGKLGSRSEVFNELGLDPAKKLIVYGSSPLMYSPNQARILSGLAALVNGDRLSSLVGSQVQLLVRISPQEVTGPYASTTLDAYWSLEGPNVKISLPLVRQSSLDMDLSSSDHQLLGRILAYADVVGNANSTFALDGIAAGKPVFGTFFEDEMKRMGHPFDEYHHLKQMIATGGVRVTRSLEDMCNAIEDYLADPMKDVHNRMALADRFLYKLDGYSSARIAQRVIDSLESTRD